MEQLLLLRELGSIPPSKAELYRRTQLLAALHVPQSHGEEVISFTNAHKAGVNALALETQEGQLYGTSLPLKISFPRDICNRVEI